MRRKCACSRFNGIDWVWSKSPFGQIISTHFRFRRPVPIRTKGFQRGGGGMEKKKGAWFRFLIVNSKFNSSQKRVQSRGRVDSFGKIGTYLIASVFEREGEGKKEKEKRKKKGRVIIEIEIEIVTRLVKRNIRGERERENFVERSFERIKSVWSKSEGIV